MESSKAPAPPPPIPCHFKRYTFYVWRPGAAREQIIPPVRPAHISKNVALRILAVPNRRRKFATIRCAGSPRIPFLPRAHGRDLEADCPCYCGQKMSRAAGSTPARAAPGMATTSCCGNSCLRRTKNSPGRTADSDRRAALANDYCCVLVPCGALPPPPLASLVGFRSRTSTCGLSFFSSLIFTFLSLLVVFLVLDCVSRAEILAAANDLFVWDQVVQTDQLIFRTLLSLSSTLPRICVLFFLRRTHIRPITTICAMTFLAPVSSAIRRF